MSRPVAHDGVCLTIVFALLQDGTSPALEFFEGLEDSDQAGLLKLFQLLGNFGKISSDQKFKKVDAEIWEFKKFQIRMPCAYARGGLVIVSHGFIKKGDKMPPTQLQRARDILAEDERIAQKQASVDKEGIRKTWRR